MTIPPLGNKSSWRWVVVCLPLASSSHIAFVARTSLSIRRLIIVDLPTPDEPTNAIRMLRKLPLDADLEIVLTKQNRAVPLEKQSVTERCLKNDRRAIRNYNGK